MRQFIFIGILLLFQVMLSAQTDTVRLDATSSLETMELDSSIAISASSSSPKGIKKFWRGDYPNPKKALFIALALPGAGQIYNRKYWKTPIFYGGMGALIYLQVDNVRTYRTFKRNYAALVDRDDNTVPDAIYSGASEAQLRSARDQAQVYVEYTAVGMGLLYLFAVADAFVDAHLASFDVSDDLSLRLKPHIENTSIGLGVALTFP